MKILVIDEKLTTKEIENMVITMFRQKYAQVKVSAEGSVGLQFILYKKLIDVGDIDIDVNDEETEASFNELVDFLQNTVKLYNQEYKTRLVLETEDIIPRYKRANNSLHVKAIVRYSKGGDEATHFDIELKIIKEIITIAKVKDIEIRGKSLEWKVFTKLATLSNIEKYSKRIGKDLKALNTALKDCDENGINADKLVDLMKSNFYPRGKYEELTNDRNYKKLKDFYNSSRPTEKVEVAFKRIFSFLKPLLKFEGQNYDRWDSKLGWIKKDNK